MKDLMMLYGVTLGKRYTFKQKTLFIEALNQQLEPIGCSFQVQSGKNQRGVTNNVIIGDLKTARIVVAAAYDTLSRSYLPGYRYYPFNTAKNLHNDRLQLLLQFGLSSICFILIYFLLKDFTALSLFFKISSAIGSGALLILGYRLLKGQANPVNFKRNSASLALMTSCIMELKDQPQVAWAFLDNTCGAYDGLKLLKEQLLPKTTLILLDSLSAGEKLILAHGVSTVPTAKKLLTDTDLSFIDKVYQDDEIGRNVLSIIPGMLYLVSGSIMQNELTVLNTRSAQDYAYDHQRLTAIRALLLAYIKGEIK